MEIQLLLRPLQRWWWLLVAATLISVVSSFVVVIRQPYIYRAASTLIIGRAIEDPNPSSGELFLAQQLATTYADIANREPIQEATKAALGIDWLPEYYARAVPNSLLIEIAVTDIDPQRAQVVANELANQLILRSPTSARPEDQERETFIAEQLSLLENQISETQTQIEELQARLGELVSAREISESQSDILILNDKLNTLQGNYSSLLANTQSGATNTLAILETADVPSQPIGPNRLLTIALSAIVSLSLATGAAYLMEFLDKTITSVDELERLYNSTNLATIPEVQSESTPWLFVNKNPRSEVADAFRSLRTNLEFLQINKEIRTLLVTSSDVGDGKSTVAINLAFIMAHADKNVLLIDGDLRRPILHEALSLPNDSGFTDLFINRHLLSQLYRPWGQPAITVISSGVLPPNPTDLLDSHQMNEILAELRTKFDMIIIDGPPFIIPDAAILAAKVDGVLAVVRPGHAQEDKIRSMRKQLELSGANLIGLVVNRVRVTANHYNQYYLVRREPGEQDSIDAGDGPERRVEEKKINLPFQLGRWRGNTESPD